MSPPDATASQGPGGSRFRIAAQRLRTAADERRWLVIGALGLVGVVLAVAVTAAGGSDAVRSGDVTSPPTATDSATTHATSTTVDAAADGAADDDGTPASGLTTSPTTSTTIAEYDGIDVDEDDPAVVARPIPEDPDDEPPAPTVVPPPWAASTRRLEGGHLATDVGCARDLSPIGLDTFFAGRVGPVLGWDYQHVYPLGGDRYLWIFQDAFIDHSGTKTTLGGARFVHNAAMIQTGRCFTLLHRGTAAKPEPFELGTGSTVRSRWFWPMGGDLVGDELFVFWAEMVKDPYDPRPPDGLGWHPTTVHISGYDVGTFERRRFQPAPDAGAVPIYGYAVSSDSTHTYLFGNTFEQNFVREGGFWSGAHSATRMWLARVPRGRLFDQPEYRTADGWSQRRADAVPISQRYFAENPMQPRFLDGQWVSATAVDGYWGDDFAIDVAPNPWGPWSTVQYGNLIPRNNDPKMNTYHAHVLPWRDPFGSLLISVSNNARNMLRDAWPNPHRYRPVIFFAPYQPVPSPTTTTTTTTTIPPTTTAAPPTTRPATTTTTTRPTTTTTRPTTTTTTTTVPPTTTTTTTTVPPTTTTSTTLGT